MRAADECQRRGHIFIHPKNRSLPLQRCWRCGMSEDLRKLYRRAKRSKSVEFMNEVFMRLISATMLNEAEDLNNRILEFMQFKETRSFTFNQIMDMSGLGREWYRTS